MKSRTEGNTGNYLTIRNRWQRSLIQIQFLQQFCQLFSFNLSYLRRWLLGLLQFLMRSHYETTNAGTLTTREENIKQTKKWLNFSKFLIKKQKNKCGNWIPKQEWYFWRVMLGDEKKACSFFNLNVVIGITGMGTIISVRRPRDVRLEILLEDIS